MALPRAAGLRDRAVPAAADWRRRVPQRQRSRLRRGGIRYVAAVSVALLARRTTRPARCGDRTRQCDGLVEAEEFCCRALILRLDEGHGDDDRLNLIIEVTRLTRPDKETKVATGRDMWVPAVNNHGAFGRWAFLEVSDPWDAQSEIRTRPGD
jgi:hypothetical protein